MGRDGGEEPRTAPEARSELLRGQLKRFTEQVAAAGKATELFELEMWLRSFERFFRIKHQPLSESETRAARAAQLVRGAAARRQRDPAGGAALHGSILTEEQVNLTRFDQYVEGYLKKDESASIPTSRSWCGTRLPEAALTLLREAFEDLHLLLIDLVKLSRLPYSTFNAVGKILYREVRRSHLLALLIDKKFKPIHDRITNPAIAPDHPRDPGHQRAAAGGQGLPGALPPPPLPRVRRPRAAPEETLRTRS